MNNNLDGARLVGKAYAGVVAAVYLPIYTLLIFGPLFVAGFFYESKMFKDWPLITWFGDKEFLIPTSIIFLYVVPFIVGIFALLVPLYKIQKSNLQPKASMTIVGFLNGNPLRGKQITIRGLQLTWTYMLFLSSIVLFFISILVLPKLLDGRLIFDLTNKDDRGVVIFIGGNILYLCLAFYKSVRLHFLSRKAL